MTTTRSDAAAGADYVRTQMPGSDTGTELDGKVQQILEAIERSPVACSCTVALCGHQGDRCGKPSKFKLKMEILVGDGQYTPSGAVGICDECWANLEAKFPFLRPRGK